MCTSSTQTPVSELECYIDKEEHSLFLNVIQTSAAFQREAVSPSDKQSSTDRCTELSVVLYYSVSSYLSIIPEPQQYSPAEVKKQQKKKTT